LGKNISGIANSGARPSTQAVRFTLPNILTVSRIPMTFVIAALMYLDWHWAATWAFWLFIGSALTDWLDGWLARRANQVSAFGRFMDAVIDKVMVIGLLVALINGGYFHGFRISAMMLLLLILAREFAISGLRMAAAAKGIVVVADQGGKLKTFTQLNAIGWLLGARMFERDFHDFFSGARADWINVVQSLGLAWYGLAALLTVTSGLAYFWRHGHVVRD